MSKIIDFHCHLDKGSPGRVLDLQARYPVETSVIHPAFEDFKDLAGYHDRVAKMVQANAGKIEAFIGIDFKKDPEEIITTIDHVGAKGVKIHPILQDIEINDKDFMAPFMEVINKHHVPVYVHTDKPGVPDFLKYKTTLKNDFGRISKNFPGVTFIMGHAGNNDSYLDAKLLFSLRPNTLVETSLAPVPSEFEKMIKQAEGGENRILFGSNEPYSSFAVELKKIEVLNITPGQRENILHDNARRVLGP